MTSQAQVTVRICHLYPRLFSVAGDRGNLFALMQRCAWRGIGYSVEEADVGVVPDFAQSDLILLHGGQDREMTVAGQDLAAKAGALREAIEGGAVVMAVCAGYQLLGRYYAPADGPPIEGIGVLDLVTEGGATRFIGHAAVDCDLGSGTRRLLAGFENHSGRTYLGSGTRPLGRVLAGSGNNGKDGTEGARYREVYATYLHGPVLPKNPWLADHLLGRALRIATRMPARSLRSRTRLRRMRTLRRCGSPAAPPGGGGRLRPPCPGSAWRGASGRMSGVMQVIVCRA